jgi:hypothetical protein
MCPTQEDYADMSLDNMRIRCWHCDNYEWLCDAKHFWKPIIEGLFLALVVGVMIGFLFKLLYNPGGL